MDCLSCSTQGIQEGKFNLKGYSMFDHFMLTPSIPRRRGGCEKSTFAALLIASRPRPRGVSFLLGIASLLSLQRALHIVVDPPPKGRDVQNFTRRQ